MQNGNLSSETDIIEKRQRTSWFARHPIATYLMVACGITWVCWIISIVVSNTRGYLLPAQDVYITFIESGFSDAYHVFVSVVFILGGFGPLVGAVVAARLESGKAGVAELWGQTTRLRIGVRWYLNAVLIALAIAGVAFLLVALTPLANFDSSGLFVLAPFIPLILLWEILISFGEEPGWRGFLLPRLQARFGGKKYIWFLGLIWAIWHYPYVVYHTISPMVDTPVPVMVIGAVFSLAGYTVSLIGQTYIYVWLYNNTRSVFLAVLFHGLLNVTTLVAVASMEDFNPIVSLTIALMPWAVVVVMERILGKDNFPGSPPAADKSIA